MKQSLINKSFGYKFLSKEIFLKFLIRSKDVENYFLFNIQQQYQTENTKQSLNKISFKLILLTNIKKKRENQRISKQNFYFCSN